jgi:SAM-dependent methyltransferase
MNKTFARVVALLLSFCLLQESCTAAMGSARSNSEFLRNFGLRQARSLQSPFTAQALAPSVPSFHPHNKMAPEIAEETAELIRPSASTASPGDLPANPTDRYTLMTDEGNRAPEGLGFQQGVRENFLEEPWRFLLENTPGTFLGKSPHRETNNFWRKKFIRLVRRNRTARILDLGTGHGGLLTAAQVSGKKRNADFALEGLDIAPRPDGFPEYASYHQGSMDHMSVMGGSVDLAVSMFGFGYSDPDKSLRELARVLKPGAEAVFIVHDPESEYTDRSARKLAQIDVLENIGILDFALEYFSRRREEPFYRFAEQPLEALRMAILDRREKGLAIGELTRAWEQIQVALERLDDHQRIEAWRLIAEEKTWFQGQRYLWREQMQHAEYFRAENLPEMARLAKEYGLTLIKSEPFYEGKRHIGLEIGFTKSDAPKTYTVEPSHRSAGARWPILAPFYVWLAFVGPADKENWWLRNLRYWIGKAFAPMAVESSPLSYATYGLIWLLSLFVPLSTFTVGVLVTGVQSIQYLMHAVTRETWRQWIRPKPNFIAGWRALDFGELKQWKRFWVFASRSMLWLIVYYHWHPAGWYALLAYGLLVNLPHLVVDASGRKTTWFMDLHARIALDAYRDQARRLHLESVEGPWKIPALLEGIGFRPNFLETLSRIDAVSWDSAVNYNSYSMEDVIAIATTPFADEILNEIATPKLEFLAWGYLQLAWEQLSRFAIGDVKDLALAKRAYVAASYLNYGRWRSPVESLLTREMRLWEAASAIVNQPPAANATSRLKKLLAWIARRWPEPQFKTRTQD